MLRIIGQSKDTYNLECSSSRIPYVSSLARTSSSFHSTAMSPRHMKINLMASSTPGLRNCCCFTSSGTESVHIFSSSISPRCSSRSSCTRRSGPRRNRSDSRHRGVSGQSSNASRILFTERTKSRRMIADQARRSSLHTDQVYDS